MNLIEDLWIPIQRHDGTRELIAPWQITDAHADNPIMTLDAPRPDFNGALMQFLIGLLQTTTEIQRDRDWRSLLHNPPTPKQLREQFASVAEAFELNSDKPCFMQDYDDLSGEVEAPISALLIEAPGGNTLKNNLDHFIKRDGVQGICPACAATALFTLQTNAPSGGVGHRTSLRGGGPLTTLVVFDPRSKKFDDEQGATLWRNLWLNVLPQQTFLPSDGPDKNKPADIFPWLAPTRTSESKTGKDTTLNDVHPAQMYWAMPRRIQLRFDTAIAGICDVCGIESESIITHYFTKNYGVNYSGSWRHPLTPYSSNKDGELLPRHPQPGGMGYRHWLGLIQGEGQNQQPAQVVSTFKDRNRRLDAQLLVWAFGYDMDNMKARCWYDSTIPLYQIDDDKREEFEDTVRRCVQAASDVRIYLQSAIKDAWFKRPGDIKGDFSFIELAFWRDTEMDFYTVLHDLAEALNKGEESLPVVNREKERWYQTLRRQALALFRHWVFSANIEYEDPRRIANAYNRLSRQLYGKNLREKTLALPVKKAKSKSKGESLDATSLQ